MIALFSVVAAEAAVSTVSGCVISAAAVRISAKTTVAVVVGGAASETAELKDGRKNHSMNIKTFKKPNWRVARLDKNKKTHVYHSLGKMPKIWAKVNQQTTAI